MTNRRNFLKTTALATAGVAFQAFNGKSEEAEIDVSSGKVNKPIVTFYLEFWSYKPIKPLGKCLKIKAEL
jgi:hypothetical protein